MRRQTDPAAAASSILRSASFIRLMKIYDPFFWQAPNPWQGLIPQPRAHKEYHHLCCITKNAPRKDNMLHPGIFIKSEVGRGVEFHVFFSQTMQADSIPQQWCSFLVLAIVLAWTTHSININKQYQQTSGFIQILINITRLLLISLFCFRYGVCLLFSS